MELLTNYVKIKWQRPPNCSTKRHIPILWDMFAPLMSNIYYILLPSLKKEKEKKE